MRLCLGRHLGGKPAAAESQRSGFCRTVQCGQIEFGQCPDGAQKPGAGFPDTGRHAPFYGWIRDLSAQDPTSILNLFGLIPYNPHAVLPAFLSFISIGVWPIIYGVTQWMQTKLNPPPPDPIQARMFALMPFIFTFMFATFPAGLVIYYAWNNLLTVLQQAYIMKREGVEVNFFDNIKSKPKAALPKAAND